MVGAKVASHERFVGNGSQAVFFGRCVPVTDLLDRPLVPIAGPDDAAETYEGLRPYLLEAEADVLVVHVIEKGGGAPDKAGLTQREEYAEESFDAFCNRAATDGIDVETRLCYGTDVAETVVDAADEEAATAIVFSSRGGGRWLDALSGGVRSSLVTESDRPVVVLPGG